jgi:prevent-host-death family protein
MPGRTIPQRELRNHIGEILRAAESGTEFTITVRGRPVARLGPAESQQRRRVEVLAERLSEMFAATPVDAGFAADVIELRRPEEPAGDPWASE